MSVVIRDETWIKGSKNVEGVSFGERVRHGQPPYAEVHFSLEINKSVWYLVDDIHADAPTHFVHVRMEYSV